jgi:hypothetical protein
VNESSTISLRAAVRPIDRRPIYEWAAQHVEMPAVLTVQGKFNPSISRHLIEPFHALQNDKSGAWSFSNRRAEAERSWLMCGVTG